jgi:hypothetical protein
MKRGKMAFGWQFSAAVTAGVQRGLIRVFQRFQGSDAGWIPVQGRRLPAAVTVWASLLSKQRF